MSGMARRQRVALFAGSLLSLAALVPPVSRLADQRLSLHMLEEMTLLALVLPLLAYGVSPLLHGRAAAWMHPVAGIVGLNLVLFGSQFPAVLDLAVKSAAFREGVQAIFMMGGFVFWYPIVSSNRLSPIAKIGCLMVAGVPPTIPGMTLAISHHLFYQSFGSIEDQQVAGLILFATAKFALVAGTFVILWRMLAPEAEPPDRDDREVPGGDLPPGAPAWLERLDDDLPAEPSRPRRPVPTLLQRHPS
jgi:cytochrome c oxidase assembly factor CtaG